MLSREWLDEKARREASAGTATAGSWIYFIQAKGGGPIKIGLAANPASRLATLQTSHHKRLRILAARPGGRADEHDLHYLFAGLRLRGEWFRPGSELLAYVKALREAARP